MDSKPSIAIAKGIAILENVNPQALATARDIKLYDYVDPDALDKLVTSDEDVSVYFFVEDYRIEITESKLVVETVQDS
ncbi:hypothetical protein AArcMg_2459 [Natrarchaeobaculum sulfurireducens]|uniref:Halobacterial output domain-containing protein n=2 Tax=Natrarchaeobaculum sulfurireducens TaxID=2044521 RepID=A0A346PSF6_9EURY|nr:hypothetical protein AArcMg_2459 [Natrarchaeobaculum sulfurireducens]